MEYSDDDLEPFLSEVTDEKLPPRLRLGSLLYLEARETFLSERHRKLLEDARDQICRALAFEAEAGGLDRPGVDREQPPPRTQGRLFPGP